MSSNVPLTIPGVGVFTNKEIPKSFFHCLSYDTPVYKKPSLSSVYYYLIGRKVPSIQLRLFQYCSFKYFYFYSRRTSFHMFVFVLFAKGFYKSLMNHYRNKIRFNYGLQISPNAQIGKNFQSVYSNLGITWGSKIGSNVSLSARVTLSPRAIGEAPTLEDNVKVYSGAVIVGPVVIGENSVIAANSLVTRSFPKNSVIMGVPAKKVMSIKQPKGQH